MPLPIAIQFFAVVGGFVVLRTLYTAYRMFSIYASPSQIHRYLHGPAPYALVTGGTEGIGKAVAKELYLLGFNLILHERDEGRLRRARQEIQAYDGAKKDVRTWVADANSRDVDFEAAVREWKDLDITLVVHNVGGAPVRDTT